MRNSDSQAKTCGWRMGSMHGWSWERDRTGMGNLFSSLVAVSALFRFDELAQFLKPLLDLISIIIIGVGNDE